MEEGRLIRDIVDQIKEAQVKLGYVRETVRLYYTVSSLNRLLGLGEPGARELLGRIERECLAQKSPQLGELKFARRGDRIEVSIPPEGAEYVNRQVETPAFLADLVGLFSSRHACSLEDVRNIFEKYGAYVCEKMPQGMDFDWVLYFADSRIDPYRYCVKEEMGHTIYHRFTREDYEDLLKDA